MAFLGFLLLFFLFIFLIVPLMIFAAHVAFFVLIAWVVWKVLEKVFA